MKTIQFLCLEHPTEALAGVSFLTHRVVLVKGIGFLDSFYLPKKEAKDTQLSRWEYNFRFKK